MLRPYVGITDFMDFEEVRDMVNVFQKYKRAGTERMLHVGVMMSFKTLNGIETKWSKAFPAKESIADIFISDSEDVLNCLHYADYDHTTDFFQHLATAIIYGGVGIDAVQLDMVWPDPGQIANGVHTSRKQVEVILQVGKNAIEVANDDPDEVARRLEDYDGVVQRVLLDKSMGRGLGMDAKALIPFAAKIKERCPDIGLGAAGGLGPKTINLAEPLLKEFPDLSIDAQGKLRPSGSALDPIDWNMAAIYLKQALELVH